jgi:hypothetical protein
MSSERQDSGWQLHHSISTSSNQHSAAELLELVDRMRDAGAHHTIDLPTMVVCGTQSEGAREMHPTRLVCQKPLLRNRPAAALQPGLQPGT